MTGKKSRKKIGTVLAPINDTVCGWVVSGVNWCSTSLWTDWVENNDYQSISSTLPTTSLLLPRLLAETSLVRCGISLGEKYRGNVTVQIVSLATAT